MKQGYKQIERNIWKAPNGTFWVNRMVNGVRHRVPCGKKIGVARDFLAKLIEQGRRAKLFPEEAQAVARRIWTLEDLIERYEPEIAAKVKPKTLASYRGSDKHLLKFFSGVPIHGIALENVKAFEVSRLENAARASVNRDLERLRSLLNLAERDRLIARSPLRGVKLLKKGRVIERYLTEEEEIRLREVCDPETWRVIEFAWRTGMRAGEQMTFEWSGVRRGRLQVFAEKTQSRRHLPITKPIQAILDTQRGLHARWVFPNPTRTNHIHMDNFRSRVFYPALKAAEIKDFRWHDLRHTFCSRLIMAGASLPDVRDLAGHASIQTTMRYIYLSDERLRDSMDLL